VRATIVGISAPLAVRVAGRVAELAVRLLLNRARSTAQYISLREREDFVAMEQVDVRSLWASLLAHTRELIPLRAAAIRSCGLLINVMKPSEHRYRDDLSSLSASMRRACSRCAGRPLSQRSMRAPAVEITDIFGQDLLQMPLIEDEHVVQALGSDGSHPSARGVGSRRSEWCANLGNTNIAHPTMDIPRMRVRSSTAIGRRPGRPVRRERRRQYVRQLCRCQRSTVSGFTTRREVCRPLNQRHAKIQKRRSTSLRRGRGLWRCRTISCCRRQRLSAISSAFG
jgi:hypothetical protein